jgi:hypothetical protein
MHGISSANPHADSEQVQDAYDMMMAARQVAESKLSMLLPQFIKATTLSYLESADLSKMVSNQQGVAIYDFIMRAIDLTRGAVQDKLRQKYIELKLQPTDTIIVVAQQVDLKWFLHKHHTLYDVTTIAGRREGVRAVLTQQNYPLDYPQDYPPIYG